MKDWLSIGAAALAGLALVLVIQGCGGKGAQAPQRSALSAADRSAVETAAKAVAEAAHAGDTAALDALINPNLPDREKRQVQAALAALTGTGPFEVTGADGLGGGATATLSGPGGSRTWRFDRVGGEWKLTGV